MDPQKITELANLLRNNGDKILSSEFKLMLSGTLLRALNDSFKLIADTAEIGNNQTFQVVKPMNTKSPVFRDLQLIHDFVQKTTLLCIVHYPIEDYFEGIIDINKFRALRRLEVQKTQIKQIIGIQPLRAQLQQLICVKSLRSVDEIITHCGGDKSNGFVWNELKIADFSYNNLQTVDSSLEFAQYLQHLNLRHNQLRSVEAIKWLPQLKTLDLSYNRLQCIPQFHMEACKRLQSLNMSNNLVEDLMGIAKLDALTDLDLSDNCMLDHSSLLPLSALVTLKFLNLYGNPLHCHPKHRLATAQFLHKNTATVKFILDFEPLSKNEKAITGSQQLRHVGSLNRYTTRSSTTSISSGRLTPSSHTPASSVGSLRSFRFQETSPNVERPATLESNTKKRAAKVRTVEIEDPVSVVKTSKEDSAAYTNSTQARIVTEKLNDPMTKSLIAEMNTEHLEAKKQIETLREKYGNEWLQSGNAEMMHSVLGIETANNRQATDNERNISRQLFNDYLGEFSTNTNRNSKDQPIIIASTPTNKKNTHTKYDLAALESDSPIMSADRKENASKEDTRFVSINNSTTEKTLDVDSTTFYRSAFEGETSPTVAAEAIVKTPPDEQSERGNDYNLESVYASTADEEPDVSEPEDDEETYIVYTSNRIDAIFLTISSNFLREKDTLTQRTKTKWSLKILESCERLKSNTLKINFDTVKKDKQERVYTVEDDLCQELEKKLRDILSTRDLTEMNQTIYRCVNCSCQFSRENKYKRLNHDVRCPECTSTFVAEIHVIPESLEGNTNSAIDIKLSPAFIVEESPVTTPLIVKPKVSHAEETAEAETVSIGSANSLNESSSCSKISNSQSSFDSNQSIAGSSNTDRENDFKSTNESDVDILSNPSQSSIEILDHVHLSSRKTSEERRISQIPNLETIDDQSYTQSYIDRHFSGDAMNDSTTNVQMPTEVTVEFGKPSPTKIKSKPHAGPLANFNLTESSSSGSITDSVCTAYEQTNNPLQAESQIQIREETTHTTNNNNNQQTKQEPNSMKREDSGISSMFGALFQSTNILMSSSKKLIDTEATAGTIISPNSVSKYNCTPYKFNYTDFNDIDHRLKLYFYQTKFEEAGEHFKWIVRGRIYNKTRQTLSDGIVVMSTCKCYVMEAYAPEHDDVAKWLRQIVSVTVDRLESIQLLPWKIGLSFQLRDWGGFLLLLQDILRTDSLLLYFANNTLPVQCELKYQPNEQMAKRLSLAVVNEKLKMYALLNGCEITCENAKRCFNICGLLTTDAHLYLTSSKLEWLSDNDSDIELCVTQLMSNLVDVERSTDTVCAINFLDETQNKCELWKCVFETKEIAESCLNAISQSWEQLFGVSLFST